MTSSTRSRPTPSGARGQRDAAQRRQRLMMIGIGVLVVGLAIVVALTTTPSSDARVDLEDIVGSPQIEGEALPAIPEDPSTDPAIGALAPVVRGADFDGTPVAIGDTGTPQLVAFLAHWCPACEQELPEVAAWMDAGGLPDGVELVAVSSFQDPARPNWPPTDWFDREGFDGPILSDDADSSVMGSYGLSATPSWAVLDADGEVVLRLSGMVGAERLDALAELALSSS